MPNKPSFTLTYWRPWNENSSFVNSWLDYNKDLSLVDYQAETINKNLNRLSLEQTKNINTLSEKVNNGFGLIVSGLFKINETIALTSYKLDQVIQAQIASNIILEDIKELIKVPEREKERIYHIESGLKFLTHVNINSEFYDDAYKEFKQAETLKPQDYYTAYNIGMIELYSAKHINIISAKKYFSKAIKYASIDTDNNEYKYLNTLFSKHYGINTDFVGKKLLTICYIQSSICSYILGNDLEAYNTLVEVMPCDGDDELYYHAAKYASRLNREDLVYPLLDYCLQVNIDKINRIVNDLDFIINPIINKYLTDFVKKIETDFEKFEKNYKGKNEYIIYQNINYTLSGLNNSISSKYKMLKYYKESYITSEILKQVDNDKNDEKLRELNSKIKIVESKIEELKISINVVEERFKIIEQRKSDFENKKFDRVVVLVIVIIVFIFCWIGDIGINAFFYIGLIGIIILSLIASINLKNQSESLKSQIDELRKRHNEQNREWHSLKHQIESLTLKITKSTYPQPNFN